jgi:hypothetical protein
MNIAPPRNRRNGPETSPNHVAERLTGRPYVTYSEVSTFQACPLRWHFGYVERAKPESISAAMLLGTCVHAAIQHYLETRLAVDREPTLDELMETYARLPRRAQSLSRGKSAKKYSREAANRSC